MQICFLFFFQAEDGIRDLVRSRGLGDVYKRQQHMQISIKVLRLMEQMFQLLVMIPGFIGVLIIYCCLLYTSDAADERSSVDLGGRRIIQKKKSIYITAITCNM